MSCSSGAECDFIAGTPCPICGGNVAPMLKFGGVEVLRCKSCDVGITSPPESVINADYTELPTWSQNVADQEEKFRGYQRKVLCYVQRHVRAGRLMDVGCSTGLLVDEARRAGFEAEGIDLDPHAVARGKSAGRPVHRAAIDDWDGGSYDVVCLSHTLEHVRDPAPFLRSCAALLKPQGVLCVVVPCYTGLLPKVVPRWWYGWVLMQHYYHYSVPALERLFHAAGMNVIYRRQYSMAHNVSWSGWRQWRDTVKSIIAAPLARLGGWIGLGDQVVVIGRPHAGVEVHGRRAQECGRDVNPS
jgi:SAM-dependent methyltransferase